MKVIENTGQTISRVYHIADIHIRLFKRHDEYKLVFKNLFSKLDNSDNQSVMVVVGDILHSKTELSPECVQISRWFFNNLAQIMPVFVVCGNHDTNLNNKNRLDSLTPILQGINNIHYLKETRHYRYNNLVFGVTTVKEKKILPALNSKDLPSNCHHIALFHGTVHDSCVDVGFRLSSKKFLREHFRGYHLVMLGDIHRHQFLDDKKTIAYSSSLIQQNHGEDVNGHGFLLWDLSTHTAKFNEINNDYGYYTVRIDNGKIINNNQIKKHPRLRFEICETDSTESKKLINDFCSNYDVQELLTYRVQKNQSISETDTNITTNSEKKLHNLADIVYWLDKFIPEEQIEPIKVLHQKYLDCVPCTERPDIHTWRLLKLEFSNMFCYTNKIQLDFTQYTNNNLGQVIAIHGSNHSGKSSILDVILYCLYDKCSRGDRKEVLNCNKKNFYCRLDFEINAKKYYILRTGNKTPKSVKVDVVFRRIDHDGNEVDLAGIDRYQTNNKIANMLGTFEDLTVTSISLQNQSNMFIEMTQSNRKKLLNDLLRLQFYEKLFEKANSDLREINTEIKVINKKFPVEKINELQDNLKTQQQQLEQTNNELTDLQQQIDNHQHDKETLLCKLQENCVENSDTELSTIQRQYTDVINQIKQIDVDLEGVDIILVEKDLQEVKDDYIRVRDNFQQNSNRINNEISVLQAKLRKYSKIPQTREQLKRLKHVLENRASPEFINKEVGFLNDIHGHIDFFDEDEDINYVKQQIKLRLSEIDHANNSTVNDNGISLAIIIKYLHQHDENDKFREHNTQLNKQIDELTIELNSLEQDTEYKQQYDQFREYYDFINNNTTKKRKLEQSAVELNDVIEQIKQDQQRIVENKKIKQQIKVYEAKINGFKIKQRKIQNKITSLNSEISLLHQRISDINQATQQIELLNKNRGLLELYTRAISKNGIPYMQLQETVPYIEEKVNEILTLITDFTVEFRMDGKNIDIYLNRNRQSCSILMASGFEKFICSIAIRVAMMNISLLPKPNFIAIDEGFGALDAENLGSINVLFNYLKSDFECVLIISHIDLLKNDVENIISPAELKNGFGTEFELSSLTSAASTQISSTCKPKKSITIAKRK